MELIVVILMETSDKPEDSRPNFGPKQVRSPDELVVGRKYISHFRGGGSSKFTVISAPFEKNGEMWVKTAHAFAGEVTLTERSISDMGVLPYKGGWWNPYCWLERS